VLPSVVIIKVHAAGRPTWWPRLRVIVNGRYILTNNHVVPGRVRGGTFGRLREPEDGDRDHTSPLPPNSYHRRDQPTRGKLPALQFGNIPDDNRVGGPVIASAPNSGGGDG